MQDLDADALYAIFKSLPSTEENLQQAHMWSKTNHAFKDTFDSLVSNQKWMQPIRFKVEFLKNIDNIYFYAVGKKMLDQPGQAVSELDVKSMLAGVEIYQNNIEILQKISELVEKLTCKSQTPFSHENSNLIGRLGGIQEFVSILKMYPAPRRSDYVYELPQFELHKITCKALYNLFCYSDSNRHIFINMNGIEVLARIDKLGGQYYDTESRAPSYVAALWNVLPLFGCFSGMPLSHTNRLKNQETKERIKDAYRRHYRY
jgi:hypothetical protein